MASSLTRQKRRLEDDDERDSKKTWSKYLVMERIDGTFERTSRILIFNGIKGMAGEPKDLKKIGPNKYLIETEKPIHSDLLLKTHQIADIAVKITPHNSMNFSKGVIKSLDLKFCKESEILQQLKPYGAIAVKKIQVKRDNVQQPTGTHIITFNNPSIPTNIKLACLNLKVETYVPNPMQCFNCQRYGHTKTKCTRKSICPKCGEDGHQDTPCTSELKCSNCSGAHPAYSRKCPKWQMEKEVQAIHFTSKISFPEARKLVEAKTPSRSYASVATVPPKQITTREISTQTDENDPIPPAIQAPAAILKKKNTTIKTKCTIEKTNKKE